MVVEKKSTRGIKKKHKRNDQVTKKYYLALRLGFQMKCVDCKPSFGVACVCVCVCVCVLCSSDFYQTFCCQSRKWPFGDHTCSGSHTYTHSCTRAQTKQLCGWAWSLVLLVFLLIKRSCIAVQLSMHIWEWASVPCGSVLSVHLALGLICIPLWVNKRHLFGGQSLPAAIHD